MALIFAALLILAQIEGKDGKVIQISQNGRDTGNCGTLAAPCYTLKAAISLAAWNDVIEIVAFRDNRKRLKPVNFCLSNYEGHRIEKNLTIRGVQGRPIISCENVYLSMLFWVESKNNSYVHFELENLEMRNSSTGLITIIGAAVRVFGCYFSETFASSAFEVSSNKKAETSSTLQVTNSTFINCGYGILVSKYLRLSISISRTKFIGNKHYSEGVNIQKPGFFTVIPWPIYLSINVEDSLFKWNMFGLVIQELPYQSHISITNTTFMKNRALGLHGMLDIGAGIRLTKSEDIGNTTSNWMIRNCRFIENEANVGAAISLWYTNKAENTTLRIGLENVDFTKNKAQQVGAAVHLHVIGGNNLASFQNCRFTENEVLATDKTGRLPILFFPALTGAGGAIYQAFGNAELNHCIFRDNEATIMGGTIASNSNITVQNCVFSKTTLTTRQKDMLGMFLYIEGNAKLENTSFEPMHASGMQSYLWFKSSAQDSDMATTNVTFKCPSGYKIRTTKVGSYRTKDKYYILAYYCDPCQTGTYSLSKGREEINGQSSVVTNPSCEKCPFGATCHTKVSVNKNFWGYTDQNEIRTIRCPSGYCCTRKLCDKLNTCASVRTGKLCGRCPPGYSENLVNNKCTKNGSCRQWWIIFVVLFLAVGCCLFFLFLPEILRSAQEFLFPYKPRANTKPGDETLNKNGVSTDSCVPSLFGVVLYFYQLQWLTQLQGMNEVDYVSARMRNVIVDILSLQPTHHLGYGCPIKGLTPVTKQLFRTSFNIFVFVVLLAIYVIYTIKTRIGNRNRDYKFLARLCRASIMLVLLNIASLANSSLTVVRCVDLSDKKVLFIDGEVYCYQIWQYIMMAYFAFCILPVVFVLCCETNRVLKRKISINVFMMSLVFPPLVLVLVCWRYAVKFVCWLVNKRNTSQNRGTTKKRSGYEPIPNSDNAENINGGGENLEVKTEKGQKHGEDDADLRRVGLAVNGLEVRHHNQDKETAEALKSRFGEMCDIRNAIISVLAKPYLRRDNSGPVYWEGVLLLRRLSVVLFSVLINNELIRQYVMILFFLVNLMIHQSLEPFRHCIVNLAESISLALLTLISAINIFFAHYLIEVEQPGRFAYTTFLALRWTLFAISAMVPATLALSLFAALLIRLGYACVSVFRYIRRRISKRMHQGNVM